MSGFESSSLFRVLVFIYDLCGLLFEHAGYRGTCWFRGDKLLGFKCDTSYATIRVNRESLIPPEFVFCEAMPI